MVSAQTVAEICNPTGVIQHLYDNYDGSDNGFASVVASHFAAMFLEQDEHGTIHQLPSLDVHHPPESYRHGTLVRFRAMVQDMSSSPELYLAKLGNHRCGGWGIFTSQGDETSDDVDYSNLLESTTLWAVSVPGESPWHAEEVSPSVPTGFPAHIPLRPHKFPIPGGPHIGVLVKIYDNTSAQLMKSADVATFIGILDSQPLTSEHESAIEVPVLHVVCHQSASTVSPDIQEPHVVRRELIDWMSECALGGDDLVAEWLLLQLTSKVHTRTTALLPPSLTISCFPHPPQSCAEPSLSHVLSELLPLYLHIPLSLELLNTQAFTPESREEDLHSGYMQLPPGSTTLLTESAVREGTVVEKGVMNVRAIREVMSSQTLEYSFPFSRFAFQTDISIIVLAEGRQSTFFQTNFVVPLKSSNEGSNFYRSADQLAWPSSEKLKAFRYYIASCRATVANVQVSELTSKHVQEDFVRRRQEDKTMTPDDLVHLLKAARLLAASRLEKEVTIETWERTKELEAQRKIRLA